jgi:hypothetical protein
MPDEPTDSPGIKSPNASVAMLVEELGVESTRELVQIYLREFERLSAELASGNRPRQHFASHSLKSSAYSMGATGLGDLMAGIEDRLTDPNHAPLTPSEVDQIIAEFAVTAGALRAFATG